MEWTLVERIYIDVLKYKINVVIMSFEDCGKSYIQFYDGDYLISGRYAYG